MRSLTPKGRSAATEKKGAKDKAPLFPKSPKVEGPSEKRVASSSPRLRSSPRASISSGDGARPKSTSTGSSAMTVLGAVDSALGRFGHLRYGSKKGSAKEVYQTLTASLPLEDFFLTELIQDDPEKMIIVPHTEPIASVVEQMHSKQLTSCIVNLATGEQEFFDCMDFGSYLLEVMTGGASTPSELRKVAEDWEAMKRKLRRVAQEPVRKALRGGLARAANGGAGGFGRLDADQSLQSLLPLLSTQRPVPIFRGGELCRTMTASDVLELCFSLADESKTLLEQCPLQEVITKVPGALSKLGISEDLGLLEVVHLMREANVHVVPILASSGSDEANSFKDKGLDLTARRSSTDSTSSTDGTDTRPLVGQFDITSLRALYVKTLPPEKDDPDSPRRPVGQWWWEDSSVTTNLFLETCMDFISIAPARGSGENLPYAAVLSSEPLTKAISRAIASVHHSVVVYQVEGPRAQTAAGTRGKPVEGLASALGLVTAMLEAGIFQKLVFDAGKPAQMRKQGHVLRRPTLTVQSVQVALEQSETVETNRKTKVTFNSIIELDHLVVPICPEHSAHFMRFTKEDESNKVMDFPALKDSNNEAKAVGASASCLACQRSLGKISQNADVLAAAAAAAGGSATTSPISAGAASPNAGLFGGLGNLASAVKDQASFNKGPGKPPSKSSLKAGTQGASRGNEASPQGGKAKPGAGVAKAFSGGEDKKTSNDRLPGGEAGGDKKALKGAEKAMTQDVSASRWNFGGICCIAPCHFIGSGKDTISAANSGGSYTRVRPQAAPGEEKSSGWSVSGASEASVCSGQSGGDGTEGGQASARNRKSGSSGSGGGTTPKAR